MSLVTKGKGKHEKREKHNSIEYLQKRGINQNTIYNKIRKENKDLVLSWKMPKK